MAIALADTPTYGGFAVATSLTFGYTIGAANSLLLVAVQADFNDVVTGATYNGSALTLIDKVSQNAGTVRWIYLFYLKNPATGTHNVVVSASGGVFIQGYAVSYSGADMTTQPDSFAHESGSSGTSNAYDTTVVAANCWLVLFAHVGSGGTQGPVTAGSGTRRVSDTDFNSAALIDSNATVGTGSQNLTANWAVTGVFAGIIASIAADGGGGGGSSVVPVLMYQYRQRHN